MADLRPILARLADGTRLNADEAEQAFDIIMSGGADLAQMAAFIMALRVRGEEVDEIVGGARVLRAKANRLKAPEGVIDTCGTGGDGHGTYNISTAAALVIAAAGVPVAKHGNRSVSSKSGSADVLMALGANLDMPEAANEQSLSENGFAFMFAPAHHRAMRHVAPARGSLQLRTIFNLLGPLANPAHAKRQVLGVFDRKWLRPMAEVLKKLGSEHVWVVHGEDGLDELTTTGTTYVAELKDGQIREFEVTPGDVGLATATLEDLKGGDAEVNAQAIRDLMAGKPSPYRDIVLMNAGAGLVVGGKAETLADGVKLAAETIDSGKAEALLNTWAAFTQAHKPEEDDV
ncbi:anthranilate phosphoribosyltransferase [Kordiimonas marina]|uniref:anthranilate phosphoribosyltransferase n=1 Tax=Kordiimonas marina TaxID=2872312 RepID=UPI001FF4B438|nr:anthranilate phosphoribosyltransferase [Kordiimonas marina]MCJ9428767.1 anthranilate phosphoribosyltransferase [Kordiimonas marina]